MVSALSFSARQSTDLYKFMLSAYIYPDEQNPAQPAASRVCAKHRSDPSSPDPKPFKLIN